LGKSFSPSRADPSCHRQQGIFFFLSTQDGRTRPPGLAALCPPSVAGRAVLTGLDGRVVPAGRGWLRTRTTKTRTARTEMLEQRTARTSAGARQARAACSTSSSPDPARRVRGARRAWGTAAGEEGPAELSCIGLGPQGCWVGAADAARGAVRHQGLRTVCRSGARQVPIHRSRARPLLLLLCLPVWCVDLARRGRERGGVLTGVRRGARQSRDEGSSESGWGLAGVRRPSSRKMCRRT
jgi:hypothetical protein